MGGRASSRFPYLNEWRLISPHVSFSSAPLRAPLSGASGRQVLKPLRETPHCYFLLRCSHSCFIQLWDVSGHQKGRGSVKRWISSGWDGEVGAGVIAVGF